MGSCLSTTNQEPIFDTSEDLSEQIRAMNPIIAYSRAESKKKMKQKRREAKKRKEIEEEEKICDKTTNKGVKYVEERLARGLGKRFQKNGYIEKPVHIFVKPPRNCRADNSAKYINLTASRYNVDYIKVPKCAKNKCKSWVFVRNLAGVRPCVEIEKYDGSHESAVLLEKLKEKYDACYIALHSCSEYLSKIPADNAEVWIMFTIDPNDGKTPANGSAAKLSTNNVESKPLPPSPEDKFDIDLSTGNLEEQLKIANVKRRELNKKMGQDESNKDKCEKKARECVKRVENSLAAIIQGIYESGRIIDDTTYIAVDVPRECELDSKYISQADFEEKIEIRGDCEGINIVSDDESINYNKKLEPKICHGESFHFRHNTCSTALAILRKKYNVDYTAYVNGYELIDFKFLFTIDPPKKHNHAVETPK